MKINILQTLWLNKTTYGIGLLASLTSLIILLCYSQWILSIINLLGVILIVVKTVQFKNDLNNNTSR